MSPTSRPDRNAPQKTGERFCLFCQKEIDHRPKRAIYCSDECQERARTKNRPFVALDGEGIEDRYVLLAAKRRDWALRTTPLKREGLSTKACLDFLLGLPKGSYAGVRPLYVWFAFDYDVNMILGDLPLKGETESIEVLRRENQVYWQGYKISYIPRKIFKLKDTRTGRTFHSVDIFTFFACTFEKALEQWGVKIPEIITKGKLARDDFSSWKLEDIAAYNLAELDALAELAEHLRAAVNPLKLKVRSWHGPGALAASYLGKHKAQRYLQKIPKELYEVSTRAYFGGRIDAAGYGKVSPVYHYDLVSAYPSAIRFLPDLSKIGWHFAKGNPPRGSTIFVGRIRWKIPTTKWGVLPWRSKQGIIRFPLQGEGWYWQEEIEAASSRFPDCLEILECWYSCDTLSFPFHNLIEESFAYRAELKREGKPSHLAVKLILNSLYGKFAQTVGKAQYYSPIWAGLITAHTRGQINRVISDDVVCTMTDSIWSKKPLKLDSSSELGGWEKQDENSLILAMAGLYEAYTPDGERMIWQRGFDKRMPVDINGIVEKWLDREPTFEGEYTVRRFIGMGLASVTSYPWRQWLDLERKIQPVPLVGTTKRLALYPVESDDEVSKVFQSLSLRPVDEDVLSYPYKKLTLDPELTEQRLLDEVTELELRR